MDLSIQYPLQYWASYKNIQFKFELTGFCDLCYYGDYVGLSSPSQKNPHTLIRCYPAICGSCYVGHHVLSIAIHKPQHKSAIYLLFCFKGMECNMCTIYVSFCSFKVLLDDCNLCVQGTVVNSTSNLLDWIGFVKMPANAIFFYHVEVNRYLLPLNLIDS